MWMVWRKRSHPLLDPPFLRSSKTGSESVYSSDRTFCEEGQYSLSCESSLCSKEWEAWQETASTAHCINFKSGLAIKACLFPLLVTEVAHPVLAAIPFHDVDFLVFGIWYKLWFLDPRALYGGCTGSNYIPWCWWKEKMTSTMTMQMTGTMTKATAITKKGTKKSVTSLVFYQIPLGRPPVFLWKNITFFFAIFNSFFI